MTPINMILFCPSCGLQHVDKAEKVEHLEDDAESAWNNPPHRSHLCARCGHI